MKFAPGEVVLKRYWRGDRISFMNVVRVVSDDERGLRLWLALGSPYWRVIARDGRSHHDAAIDQLPDAQLSRLTWRGSEVLMWQPVDRPYSIWWFFADGAFTHWYANLEDPHVRWTEDGCAGVDTADRALDLVVEPDRTWRWKDEAEFVAKTGHPLYWTEAQAAVIRASGRDVIAMVEAGRFPFDGTWCDFRPDSTWTVPGLPAAYDPSRARRARTGSRGLAG